MSSIIAEINNERSFESSKRIKKNKIFLTNTLIKKLFIWEVVMRKGSKNAKASSPPLSSTTAASSSSSKASKASSHQVNGKKPRTDAGLSDLRRITGRKSIHLTVEEEQEVEEQVKEQGQVGQRCVLFE